MLKNLKNILLKDKLKNITLLALGGACGFAGYHIFFTAPVIDIRDKVSGDISVQAVAPERIFSLHELPEQVAPGAPFGRIDESEVPTLYRHIPLKVIAIQENPFSDKEERLYVVTRRGVNDSSCGGMYSPGDCHLFLESSFAQGSIAQYVGQISNSIDFESITFVDDNTIEYNSYSGDDGQSVERLMRYNLISGKETVRSQKVCELNEATGESNCSAENK